MLLWKLAFHLFFILYALCWASGCVGCVGCVSNYLKGAMSFGVVILHVVKISD
jgi:hypothetical protein